LVNVLKMKIVFIILLEVLQQKYSVIEKE
jgi:hypothetical protein